MKNPIIQIKNLSFAYPNGKSVINSLSLDIFKGEYVSLIGHNGSGKSTIALLLMGLFEAKEGTIAIDSTILNKQNIQKIREKCALVFQNPDDQFIGATVEDDIAFGLENRCFDSFRMQSIIEEYAFKVGMLEFLKKEPQFLSGGQKQRVAIAGALALSPKILILDEATSMLDPKGKNDIRNLIFEMKKENEDLTVVSITHDIEEALDSDRVIVLSDGKVVLNGEPRTILKEEKVLKNFNLEMPFLYSFQDKLKRSGINIDGYFDDTSSLVEAICRLK